MPDCLDIFLLPHLYKQRQANRAENTQRHHRPSRLNNLLIRDQMRSIPRQMPQPVQAMEGEREREERFRSNLQDQWPSSKRGRNGRALHVQTDVWCDEVEGAEDVEGAAEGAAGDAVEAGEVPGDLGIVDGEMGGDGAVEALAGEDLVVFGCFGDGRCGGEPVIAVSLCGGQAVECPYRFWW